MKRRKNSLVDGQEKVTPVGISFVILTIFLAIWTMDRCTGEPISDDKPKQVYIGGSMLVGEIPTQKGIE